MSRRLALESLLAVALLCLATWLLNVVGGQTRARLDLTADQRHTLSPVTKRLLASLDAPLEARAYLPQGVQPPHASTVQAIRDLLEEYRAASGGRMRVVLRDPGDGSLDASAREEMAEEARGYGIEQADLVVTRGAKRVRQRVFLGVALLYRDRHATVPPTASTERLEYELTRAMREVLRPRARRPVIAVTRGRGEPDLLNSPVAQLLASAGELQAVELNGELVPQGVDALVVLGPKRAFDERARYAIDQFLMEGKALVALLDYRQRSEVFPDILVPTTTGLEPLLAHYGITVDHPRTVVDRVRNVAAAISRDAGGDLVYANHPLYVEARDLPDHPVTRGLSSLAVPMSAPLHVDARAGTEAKWVVSTGPDSRLRENVRSRDPAKVASPDATETKGPANVGVALRGTLPSYFTDRPIPPRRVAVTAGTEQRPDPPRLRSGQGEARVLLVTSGSRLLAAHANGLLLLQNAVDWALADTDLVDIRARRAADPPLRTTTAAERAAVKWGTTLTPPLLVLLAGVLRWNRRRRLA